MGFDDCWLKARPAPKLSTAKSPKRTVHETLLRSLTADLPFIQLERLVDGASGLTTSVARLPRVPQRPCHRRAAEQRDELAPSHVTCHAPLPRRHAQSNNITSLFDHSRQLRVGRDKFAWAFDIWPISHVVEEVRLRYRQT